NVVLWAGTLICLLGLTYVTPWIGLGVAGVLAGYSALKRATTGAWLLPVSIASYAVYFWCSKAPYSVPWVALDEVFFALFHAFALLFLAQVHQHGRHHRALAVLLGSGLITTAGLADVSPAAAEQMSFIFQSVTVCAAIWLCVLTAFRQGDGSGLEQGLKPLFVHMLVTSALIAALGLPYVFGAGSDRVAMVTTMCFVGNALFLVFSASGGKDMRWHHDIDTFETTPGLKYKSCIEVDVKHGDVRAAMSEQQSDTNPASEHGGAEDGVVATFGRDSTVLDGDTLGIKRIAVTKKALDKLTGVLSFETLCAVADQAIAQTKRYGRPHSAIMLRYDDFTDVRAELGEPTAQRAVKLLAVTCKRELRDSDALGRVSPDLFVGLLPETEVQGAASALHRACKAIAQRTVPTAAGMQSLRVSVSSTSLRDVDDSFDVVLDRLTANLSTDLPPLPVHAAKLPGRLD
ncbi:MAG: diguanylate cyclase, partial [Pseudomonadota bacterium]